MADERPAPAPSQQSASVRARVVARLRELSEQATLIATAASVTACGGEKHTAGPAAGGGVVHGTAGYAVVDPLPWPSAGIISRPPVAGTPGTVTPVARPMCVPSLALELASARATWHGKQQLEFSIRAPSAQANFGMFQLAEASSSAGQATIKQFGPGTFVVTVTAPAWPKSTQLSLVLKCWGVTNEVTNARFALDTSQPADSGELRVKYLTPALGEDAGVDDAGG